jgi:cold shock CspA family protein
MSKREERKAGRVKFYSPARGYGFIELAGHGHELFMHISDWTGDNDPIAGDRVTLVEVSGRDGRPRARSVMRATI